MTKTEQISFLQYFSFFAAEAKTKKLAGKTAVNSDKWIAASNEAHTEAARIITLYDRGYITEAEAWQMLAEMYPRHNVRRG